MYNWDLRDSHYYFNAYHYILYMSLFFIQMSLEEHREEVNFVER